MFKASHDRHLGTLYLYSMDGGNIRTYTWNNADMVAKYDELEGGRPDKLRNVWNYKVPLSGFRLTQEDLLFHAFVLIQTERWWYTIEVSDKNLTVQRSKCRDDVVERKEGERRITLNLGGDDWEGHEEALPGKTFRDVLHFIYQKDWLNQNYNLLLKNCKDLARAIFNEFYSKEAREERLRQQAYDYQQRWERMSWPERVHEINPDAECLIL